MENVNIGSRSRICISKTRNNALDVVCGKVTILPAAHAAATHKVILTRNSALSRQIFCFFQITVILTLFQNLLIRTKSFLFL